MKNADNFSKLKELFAGSKHQSYGIEKMEVKRSDKDSKNFSLKIDLHPGGKVETDFYNFWTERAREYKDYQSSIYR